MDKDMPTGMSIISGSVFGKSYSEVRAAFSERFRQIRIRMERERLFGLIDANTKPERNCIAMAHAREIAIKPVTNGFVVDIGCSVFVFTDKNELIKELSRYYDNPDAVEREYAKKYIEPQIR